MADNQLSYLSVKKEFDTILAKHIIKILESNDEAQAVTFNLNTITCLLLLVERENEIDAFPDSPPDRYIRESFLEDIEDTGLTINDDVMLSIQNLTQFGFLEIGSGGKYHARISAIVLAKFLDHLFPGMPGMNLVAYMSQTIDEVVTGRKDLNDALAYLEQTLKSRSDSIPVPKIEAEMELTTSIYKSSLETAIDERKKAKSLKALSGIAKKTAGKYKEPSIITGNGLSKKVKIKEIFPREREEIIEEQPPEQESIEPQIIIEEPEPEPELTEPIPEPEPEREPEPEISVEEKIKAFQEQLAMTCPICNVGKIIPNETGKGKSYYSCTNNKCSFISWGKPYHIPCPLCQNQFLIEFSKKDGQTGLKCPRATCSFWKEGLEPPEKKKPKKRLVRKRKVRRKS
ncbi:MAG: hypothetical protein K9L30_15565 [Desulfobacterales bacterium]|nr:hypothetical protein [Desulfobacterales bacterium]